MYLDTDGYYMIENPSEFEGLKSCTKLKYICKKCGCLFKCESSFRPHNIEKFKLMLCRDCRRKQTSFLRYGDENYNNREQAKQTCLDTLGVENPAKSEEVRIKGIKTHAKNIGVEYNGEKSMFEFDDVKETSKESIRETYGVDNIMQCDKGKTSYKESMLNTYGVDHPSKSKELYARGERIKEEKYGDPHYNNHEQTVCTNLDIHGYETPFHSKEIQENIKSGFIETYGVLRPIQYPKFKQKIQDSINKTYGSNWFLGSDEFKQLKVEHPEWYGEYYFSSDDFKKLKAEHPEWTVNTNITYAMVSNTSIIKFDSSWELYFYLYCLEMGLNVLRSPIELTFEYCGEIKHCYPDFIVDGKLVEIKGTQYFLDRDPSKRMIFPYTKLHSNGPLLTLEEKIYYDNLYEAKHQCMLKNGAEFLSENEILPMIKYIDDKYGKNFVNRFKVDRTMKFDMFILNRMYCMIFDPNFGYTPYNIDRSKEYQDPIGEGVTPYTNSAIT